MRLPFFRPGAGRSADPEGRGCGSSERLRPGSDEPRGRSTFRIFGFAQDTSPRQNASEPGLSVSLAAPKILHLGRNKPC